METVWSARRVARQLGHFGCVVRRWLGPMNPRDVSYTKTRLRTPTTDQSSRKPPHQEWNQVVFSEESRFNISSDDNRVCVWRPRGERLNPTFALQLHTPPTADVMVWGAIAYSTRSPLVLIRGTMTAQRYVHDFLQPHVMPLMQWLPGAIFQQDNARPHTARVSQDCLRTVTTLPCPYRSISGVIWDGELGIPRVWTN
ncbi:transposable element Tcb2 transposase [Trichonephila clavipes]|nr:transposable element Tcb2 transposase [Trichonephila clavipes]